jgi:diguanylate cyclase (GGDEF)-like protein/PAS domain S-box-containing protein
VLANGRDSVQPKNGSPLPEVVRRFQDLVERIPGIVAYMDRVQRDDPGCSIPLYISPQIEEMMGYPREAWLTDDELWLSVLHPDDLERMTAADAEARRTLSSLFAEYRMIARNGRVVWVSEKAAVVEDRETGTAYWQGVMVDITDRREAEEAQAASERLFRSMFDAAAIGVMTLDLDGRIIEANGTLESIGGYPPGGLHGRDLRELLALQDDSGLEEFTAVAAGALDRSQLEQRFRRCDRSLQWCRTVMALVRDGAGRPLQVTAMLEDISDRKEAEADLVHRALHDALTGLPNRQLFLERLQKAQVERPATDEGMAVIFIDIDGFKAANDSIGHHAGDELLVAVAGRLRQAVRPTDQVARYGGDEFLVLAGELGSVDDASQLAWRLANTLRAPFSLAGQAAHVTASFGIAYSEDSLEEPEELVRRADAAMYQAKQRGRNRVAVFGRAAEEGTAA